MFINKLFNVIEGIFQNGINMVRSINRKYATPRITMTPMVRISLLLLRIYLLVLLIILFYKFFTLINN